MSAVFQDLTTRRMGWLGASVIPLFIGADWLFLALSQPQDTVQYGLPFVLMVAAGCVLAVAASALGKPWGVSCLLVFVVFCLSLNLKSRSSGEITFGFQNITKLLTWILIVLVCTVNWRRLLPFLHNKTVVFIALYGLVAFASAVWSQTPAYSAGNALGFLAYLGLACLAVSVCGVDATLKLISTTLLCFVSVAVIAGVLIPDIAWLPPSLVETTYRLQGFSGHPNLLGEQTAILVTFATIAYRRGVISRSILAASLIIGFTALIATDSRTTTTATILAWIIIAMRQKRILPFAMALAACGGVVAIMLLSVDSFPNIGQMFGFLSRTGSTSEITTLTGRTDLWAAAAERITEKPLLGWGFTGTEALMMSSVPRNFAGDPVNAHNMYIQTVLGMGFLGSIPAFGFLGILVIRMIFRPNVVRDHIVLLMMIIGLAEASLFATPLLLTFAFFFGVASDTTLPPAEPVSAGRAYLEQEVG